MLRPTFWSTPSHSASLLHATQEDGCATSCTLWFASPILTCLIRLCSMRSFWNSFPLDALTLLKPLRSRWWRLCASSSVTHRAGDAIPENVVNRSWNMKKIQKQMSKKCGTNFPCAWEKEKAKMRSLMHQKLKGIVGGRGRRWSMKIGLRCVKQSVRE